MLEAMGGSRGGKKLVFSQGDPLLHTFMHIYVCKKLGGGRGGGKKQASEGGGLPFELFSRVRSEKKAGVPVKPYKKRSY